MLNGNLAIDASSIDEPNPEDDPSARDIEN